MKTATLIVLLSICSIFQALYAQTDSSLHNGWKQINAGESMESFQSFKAYLADSYQWDTKDRLAYLHKGYEAGIQLRKDTAIFEYSQHLGILYMNIDSMASSLFYFNQALDYSFSTKTNVIIYNFIGGLHMKNNDYSEALEYYFQSLGEAKKLNDGSEVYSIGNLSKVYGYLGDHQNAVKYLKYSIDHSRQLDSPEKEYSLVYDYAYISENFQELGQVDSAAEYLSLAIETLSSLDIKANPKYQDAYFICYFMASEFYLKEKRADKAREHIELARTYAKAFYLSAVIQLDIRHSLLIKDYDKALQLLTDEELQNEYSGKIRILELWARYYKGIQDLENLADIQEQILTAKEEQFSKDQIQFSAFADAKYEILKKGEEIKSLKLTQQIQALTIQNQRYGIILTVLFAIILFGGAVFLLKQSRDRKQMSLLLQEEVESKTKDLLKANEELRTLNHIASHDIKGPIRNIGNYLGLIQRRLPVEVKNDPDMELFFDHSQKSVTQLYTLVEDIAKYLAVSNDAVIEHGQVDMNELINTLLFSLQSFTEENKAIVEVPILPEINSNSTMLFVIFKNLVENGIKFNRSDQPSVHISYQSLNHFHLFSVSDNGIGIDTQYLDRILQPFQRLNPQDQFAGSGIGLSIVNLLVKKLGGHIEIDSHIGQGSSFHIYLPMF